MRQGASSACKDGKQVGTHDQHAAVTGSHRTRGWHRMLLHDRAGLCVADTIKHSRDELRHVHRGVVTHRGCSLRHCKQAHVLIGVCRHFLAASVALQEQVVEIPDALLGASTHSECIGHGDVDTQVRKSRQQRWRGAPACPSDCSCARSGEVPPAPSFSQCPPGPPLGTAPPAGRAFASYNKRGRSALNTQHGLKHAESKPGNSGTPCPPTSEPCKSPVPVGRTEGLPGLQLLAVGLGERPGRPL